jgi:hypothetical protein
VRKADAANGEADYSQKNKDDTNDGCRFHECLSGDKISSVDRCRM